MILLILNLFKIKKSFVILFIPIILSHLGCMPVSASRTDILGHMIRSLAASSAFDMGLLASSSALTWCSFCHFSTTSECY